MALTLDDADIKLPVPSMTEIFAGQGFIVTTELADPGHGLCPLTGPDGQALGDVNDLIRIRSRIDEHWPEAFVDQGNGSYFRLSMNGKGYGTSVVGSPSFRSVAKFQFIPEPERIGFAGTSDSFTLRSVGGFHERGRRIAEARSCRTWHRPANGRGPASVDLALKLRIDHKTPVSMAYRELGRDRFRWAMLSSMYVNDVTYDSNLLRFESRDGQLHEIAIGKHFEVNNGRRRSGHLFDRAIPVGRFLEIIKTTGSTWLPQTPSIRYDLHSMGEMDLAVQGWWSGSDNPDDDNLNIWLEWLSPPRFLEPGLQLAMSARVTALPCTERSVKKSHAPWPQRLWFKPKDYSHRMNYDYALQD